MIDLGGCRDGLDAVVKITNLLVGVVGDSVLLARVEEVVLVVVEPISLISSDICRQESDSLTCQRRTPIGSSQASRRWWNHHRSIDGSRCYQHQFRRRLLMELTAAGALAVALGSRFSTVPEASRVTLVAGRAVARPARAEAAKMISVVRILFGDEALKSYKKMCEEPKGRL